MKKVDLVIPCYNEELSLGKLFNALEKLVELTKESYHINIIFIDDGSKDNTLRLLEEHQKGRGDIQVFAHGVNKNLGEAIKTGIAHRTDSNYIAFLDSDCTYEPTIVTDMLKKIEEGHDLVTVSPYHPHGGVEGVPAWRLLLSKGISLIYRIFLLRKIYTFTAMVRVIHTDKVMEIMSERSDFAFTAEMMIHAIRKGYKIAEIPTVLRQREFGVSKMRLLNTIKAHLEIITKLILRKV